MEIQINYCFIFSSSSKTNFSVRPKGSVNEDVRSDMKAERQSKIICVCHHLVALTGITLKRCNAGKNKCAFGPYYKIFNLL